MREHAGHYEIISNGVFLMDTRDGSSERLLMRWALDAMRSADQRRILIAGLGVGWTLGEALRSQHVAEILVIEWEPDVVLWNETITELYVEVVDERSGEEGGVPSQVAELEAPVGAGGEGTPDVESSA